MSAPDNLVNRKTGLSPTPQEWQRIKTRAVESFGNPYASPEQMEWAMEVYPEGFVLAFDLSDRSEQTQRKQGK